MRLPLFARRTIARPLAIAGVSLLATALWSGSLAAAGGSPAPVYVTTVDGMITNPPSYQSPDDVYLAAAACHAIGNIARARNVRLRGQRSDRDAGALS